MSAAEQTVINKDSVRNAILNSYVRYGEQFIGKPWISPSARLFAEFKTNGNRTNYEAFTFAKRKQLAALVMAEAVEGKGRFMDDIIDGLSSTLEETWWGLPAHYGTKMMNPDDQNVDLFNAETAGLIAWTRHVLADRLDSFSPMLAKRIDREIERRILIPALNTNYWWKKASMNWNPWICSNWLACVLFCEQDTARQAKAITQIKSAMQSFYDGYPADGGCDEGPTYWDRAAASLFECELLLAQAPSPQEATPKEATVPWSFAPWPSPQEATPTPPALKKMAAYCYATYIADGYCLSFADSHGNRHVQQPNVMYPFALFVGDTTMRRFAAYIAREKGFFENAAALYDKSGNYPTLGRELIFISLLDSFLDETPQEPLLADTWLPSLQIMTARRNGMFIGMKGGHNDESHNHNDVGSFVIYDGGTPLLVDPGVGEYTSKTFSNQRYDIWTMQSAYHNLPQINGFDQRNGKQYAARDVKYSKGSLTLDISSCYPEEARINRWTRKTKIDDEGRVTLTDEYDLKSRTAPLRLMFIAATKPTINESKSYITLGSHILTYPRGCKAAIEPLEDKFDPMLRSMWPQGLWRIVITDDSQTTKGKLTFTIKKPKL
ncbi:MAG: heparinase II/III family protein [Prevotella sp.]